MKSRSEPSDCRGVLLVNSNLLQSQLLTDALRRRSEFRVVTCSAETEEVLKAIESNVIHVAVVSGRNRDDGWRELPMIRFIRLAHPEVGTVLMLEDYDQALAAC